MNILNITHLLKKIKWSIFWKFIFYNLKVGMCSIPIGIISFEMITDLTKSSLHPICENDLFYYRITLRELKKKKYDWTDF